MPLLAETDVCRWLTCCRALPWLTATTYSPTYLLPPSLGRPDRYDALVL